MSLPVVLDPGHGGTRRSGNSTPDGARFGDGRLEKEANWRVAQKVAAQLGGARLTRGQDENRAFRDRIGVARDTAARAFVSLHTVPGRDASVWIHPKASPASARLAESLRAQLQPAYGSPRISRGELAVLSPAHHHRDTAACLVELGVGGNLDVAAAAIARGVRGHLGPAYGRVARADRGLGNEIDLRGGPSQWLQELADWLAHNQRFSQAVPDTTVFPYSAICKLMIHMTAADGSSLSGVGSGFYIAPDRLLTAGHNIRYWDRNGTQFDTDSIEVIPGLNGANRPFPSFTVDASKLAAHPNYFNGGGSLDGERYDMGVIDATGHPPPNGQYFDHLDPTPASVGSVIVCGYAAETSDGLRQRVDVDTIRLVSPDTDMDIVSYRAFTEGGTSGSPVFYAIAVDDEQAQVCRVDTGIVGVHILGNSADFDPTDSRYYNSCCRLTPAKVAWATSPAFPPATS